MKLESLEKEYITDAYAETSKLLIEEYMEKIKEQEDIIRRYNLITNAFVAVLNCTPCRENGKWIVKGYVAYKKLDGSLKREERIDLEYLSSFLNNCGIKNEIHNYNDLTSLLFKLTLEERDALEDFIKSKECCKTLGRIKI